MTVKYPILVTKAKWKSEVGWGGISILTINAELRIKVSVGKSSCYNMGARNYLTLCTFGSLRGLLDDSLLN